MLRLHGTVDSKASSVDRNRLQHILTTYRSQYWPDVPPSFTGRTSEPCRSLATITRSLPGPADASRGQRTWWTGR